MTSRGIKSPDDGDDDDNIYTDSSSVELTIYGQ